jgi:hypothetical protein
MDDLIRPREHGGRDGEAEGLSGLHVDDELELRRPLDGEIRRLVGEGIIRAPLNGRGQAGARVRQK